MNPVLYRVVNCAEIIYKVVQVGEENLVGALMPSGVNKVNCSVSFKRKIIRGFKPLLSYLKVTWNLQYKILSFLI